MIKCCETLKIISRTNSQFFTLFDIQTAIQNNLSCSAY